MICLRSVRHRYHNIVLSLIVISTNMLLLTKIGKVQGFSLQQYSSIRLPAPFSSNRLFSQYHYEKQRVYSSRRVFGLRNHFPTRNDQSIISKFHFSSQHKLFMTKNGANQQSSSLEIETDSEIDSRLDNNDDYYYDDNTEDDDNDVGEYDSEDDDDESSSEDNYDDDDEDDDENSIDPQQKKLKKLYTTIYSSLQQTISNQTKKQTSLQNEYNKAMKLEQIFNRANLIVSNLYQLPPGTTKCIVQDWNDDAQELVDVELVLNTKDYNSAKEEADALFVQVRKMKRGSKIVNSLLEDVEGNLVLLQDTMMDLESCISFNKIDDDNLDSENGIIDRMNDGNFEVINEGRLHLLLERLERTSSKTDFKIIETKSDNNKNSRRSNNNNINSNNTSTRWQPTFRRLISPNGCIVLVGRNRKDNEYLCFQVAKGDDVWMHARGVPGAHVLIQVRRGSPIPSEDDFQFAANLAAFYSEGRTERKVPVTTAEPKHILKPRGAPLGAIKLRKESNTVTGYPEDVDDELKLARERSGVAWDEGGLRSFGVKAKNKKKTKAVTKQNMAKKRAEKKAKKKQRGEKGNDES